MNLIVDKHRYAQLLKDGGFSAQQSDAAAEALADALAESAATPQDLADHARSTDLTIAQSIAELKESQFKAVAEMRQEMHDAVLEFRQTIAQLKLDTAEALAQVRKENTDAIAALRQENSEAIAALRQENSEAIAALRQENSEAMAAIRQENAQFRLEMIEYQRSLDATVARLELKIEHIETKMERQTVQILKWAIPFFVGQAAMIIAMIKFL